MKLSRRAFLAQSSAALIGLSIKGDRPIQGGFVNESAALGHLIRDRVPFTKPVRTERFSVVIVGGGIAGVSAAWRLQKRGFHNFVLLEMNDQAGGNSRSGENDITAYPWAAHYVPVPGTRATYVRELFEELGVLKNGAWEERYLCFAPQERLFLYGRWQEGIEPAVGLTQADRDQFQRFSDMVNLYRASGEFTIPMELGRSQDTAHLDQLSFAEWLRQQGMEAGLFTWYMNYCCRDDFGAGCADTSAWAGIHYFASREPEDKGPLTWPEGNGWITKRLLERVGKYVRTNEMVRRITKRGSRIAVQTDGAEYQCECVIFAAPTFLAPYLVENFPALHDFEYSPWLTANLVLERLPARWNENGGAWDNVVLDSPTLGYVDATHQTLRTFVDQTVWTFYWAFSQGTPAANRRMLLARDWSYWKEAILNDLSRVHPDIRECVSRIDIMRLGHAMVRPKVGAIFSAERLKLIASHDRLIFANSDLSGFSIFEEAQYRGVEAANRALKLLTV